MSASFSGTLDGAEVGAVILFLMGQRQSGRLYLTDGRWQGEVALAAGHVVGASFGGEQGLPALEALMLALPWCRFTFTEGPAPTDGELAGLSEHLAEYLERLTVARAAAPGAGPVMEAVPRMVTGWLEPAAAAGPRAPAPGHGPSNVVLDRSTVWTLALVDGRRSVEEIIRQRGSMEAVLELAALADLGVVHFDPPASGARPVRPINEPPPGWMGRIGWELRYWFRPALLAAVAGSLLALNACQEARIPSRPPAQIAAAGGTGAAGPVPAR